MRAKIREPGASLRWFFYGLAALCVAAAVIFRIQIGPPLDPVFFIGATLIFLSPIFQVRRTYREVDIEARPGSLRITGSRGLESIIALKNITGASNARVGDEVSLALALGPDSRHPTVIRFQNDSDANAALNALGIGRHGFGLLIWNRGPRVVHYLAALARIFGALYCLAICVLAWASDSFAATLDARSMSTLIAVGLAAFVTFVPSIMLRYTLSLLPDGLRTFEERVRVYPYADIASIEVKLGGFAIERREPNAAPVCIFFRKSAGFFSRLEDSGLDELDAALIVEHVTAAAERARRAEQTPEHIEQVRTLVAKRKDETNEAWVRRLDAQADSWRASPPRHGESVSYRHALWQTVEDHECDEQLRVLAARMLAKLDPEEAPPKLRVIAEAIRDPRQASRIRIALDAEVEPMAKSIAPNSKR